MQELKEYRGPEGGRVVYYQLDFKIRNVAGGMTIKQLFTEDPIRLKPGYELIEDVSESIDKIAISDAHTHIERLVFPAFYVRNTVTGEVVLTHRCNRIHGAWTMRIHGGDEKKVYHPRTYERALLALQKKEVSDAALLRLHRESDPMGAERIWCRVLV